MNINWKIGLFDSVTQSHRTDGEDLFWDPINGELYLYIATMAKLVDAIDIA